MNSNERNEEKVDSFCIKYEQPAVTLAKQFILSASDEELMLDCSSGIITGENGEQLLPIHSRLVMPWSAARRLCELLHQVVGQQEARGSLTPSDKAARALNADKKPRRAAKLPKMETING